MSRHHRVKRERTYELKKRDALYWKGKPNVPVKEPTHINGYDPESIDKRVTEAIAKGLKV